MTPTSNRSYPAVQSRMIDRNSMATRGMHQDACQQAGDRCSEQEHELDDAAISRCTVSQWAGWMHQTILLLNSFCGNMDSHWHEYSNQARMENVGPLLALELKNCTGTSSGVGWHWHQHSHDPLPQFVSAQRTLIVSQKCPSPTTQT